MKSMILVALALVAVAVALPVDEPVKILNSSVDQQPDGSYKYQFESEDGIARQEEAQFKEVKDEEGKTVLVLVVRGSYSYPRSDGTQEVITYGADENGFSAEGPSVPKNERR